MQYASICINGADTANRFEGAGTQYLTQVTNRDTYLVYIDDNVDVSFTKSTDGGFSWAEVTPIFTGSALALSTWYQRWSNSSGGKIHCAYTKNNSVFHRSIDTESSDALSSETTIFTGVSQAAGGCISICAARGGNLYCRVCIDGGAEGGFFRSVDGGANWTSRTVDETLATQDQIILMPGFNGGDDQDMLAIFWDASANEISRKIYDNSADTWAETSIASISDTLATTAFPMFAAAPDLANNRLVLLAWSGAPDSANNDLLCWTVDESSITAKTDVVTNGTDDQGLCAVTVDPTSGEWHAIYAGKSDGSETWNAATGVNVYSKTSKDSGATWGAETQLSTVRSNVLQLLAPARRTGPPIAAWYNQIDPARYMVAVPRNLPRARSFVAGAF